MATVMLTVLFADKLVVDDREHIAEFEIPGFEGTFGLFPPRAIFWLQLVAFFILQTAIQVAFAAAIYMAVIRQRGKPASYLVGYGFIMPFAAYVPFALLEAFDVQNKTLKVSMGMAGTIPFFRCIEAMYGTSPHTVEHSVRTYMEYFLSLAHFDWSPKTKTRRTLSKHEAVSAIWRTLSHFHLLGLALSVAMHFDFKPFPSDVVLDGFIVSSELLTPQHMANCYLLGLVTFLLLATSFEMACLSANMQGFYTEQIFYNPLFSSRSPTEFWGKKWNLTIQKMLKHGVFLPARQFFPAPICVFLSFAASGLYHEYVWAILYYKYDYMLDENGICKHDDCYHPIALKTTAFFVWNAFIMLMETKVGHAFSFTKSWPTFLVSSLILLLALPVSHWFTGDWAMGGYFREFAIGLWTIRKL